ncbi:MAG TPA: hypothetical protein VII69_06055 [Candidatus Eremiobacteraceae bacterium]
MTPNADILLFTYALVVVGLTTGAQMIYAGNRDRAMYFSGRDKPPVTPPSLRQAGIIFSVVGVAMFAAMVVEILSGAAGTNIVAFIAATIIIPPVVVWYNSKTM